jgi:hypothetical protein
MAEICKTHREFEVTRLFPAFISYPGSRFASVLVNHVNVLAVAALVYLLCRPRHASKVLLSRRVTSELNNIGVDILNIHNIHSNVSTVLDISDTREGNYQFKFKLSIKYSVRLRSTGVI